MRHIGFIMDGNRRWAKKLKNIVGFGHEKGGDNIERVLSLCLQEKIEYVSMWALSSENIKSRSTEELETIYRLAVEKIPLLTDKLVKNNIRFETVGDLWLLPKQVRDVLVSAMDATAQCTEMTFIFAIAYGGQDEIIRGIRNFVASGEDIRTLDATKFLEFLDTGRFPPPDLIVRTGGDIRHSGYFLYQSDYSEYFFTDTLWPDFGEEDFREAIDFFDTKVKRNFGK